MMKLIYKPNKKRKPKTLIMNYKKIITSLLIIATISFASCTEDDEPCTETVCPDGFNSCFEKPCE